MRRRIEAVYIVIDVRTSKPAGVEMTLEDARDWGGGYVVGMVGTEAA